MLRNIGKTSAALGLLILALATMAPGIEAIPCSDLTGLTLDVDPLLSFGITPVCDRAALVATDRLDFSPLTEGALLFSGNKLFTTQGLEATLLRDPLTQDPFLGDWQILQQPSSWGGNFTDGDLVLFNRFTSPTGSDATQLQLADLVSGIGTQFQKEGVGSFIAQLQIFGLDDPGTPGVDESLTPLATLRAMGLACDSSQDPTCEENSAIFLGLAADQEVIKSATFNVFSVPTNGEGASEAPFGINKIDVGTVAVPVPATLLLAGAGMSLVGFVRRRRARP